MHHISRNGWIGLVVAAVLVGGGIALFLGGYVPQIGRFFAAEPGGYIPFCAGYGQRVTLYADGGAYPSCCSGLLPTVADAGRFETPGAPAVEASDDAAVQGRPTRDRAAYCVMPECKVYRKSVQCIQAPCEPVIEIVCPPGVTPPPTPTPYPSVPPTPTGPTSTPNPNTRVRLNLEPWLPVSVSPGQRLTIPVTLDTAGLPATAVKLSVGLIGPGKFYGVSYGMMDFPEVLDTGYTREKNLNIAVGSGPSGGAIGDSLVVGEIVAIVDSDAKPGSQITVVALPDTEVAVAGYPGNMLYFYGAANFNITDEAALPGDADGDGDVDIFDYNLVVSHFGESGPPGLKGDVDGNGKVDIFDYNLVVSNFGRGVQ